MPQFDPNEERVAIATFPVKPAGLSCTAELWLASNSIKVATSGEIPFVATGLDQSIALPLTMPDAEGTYPAHLGVLSNGQLIYLFRADEDVIIAPPPLVPSLINISLPPTVEASSEFWPEYTFFLPKPCEITDRPVYDISLIYEGVKPREYLAFFSVLPFGENIYVLAYLDNPEGVYTYRGTYGWTEYPYYRAWVPSKAPRVPGTYPIRGVIMVSHCIDVFKESWEFGPPQKTYDLGIVGYLTVT